MICKCVGYLVMERPEGIEPTAYRFDTVALSY